MIQVKLYKRKASLFTHEDQESSSLVDTKDYYGFKSSLYVVNGCDLGESSSFCVVDLNNLSELDSFKNTFKTVDYRELDSQLEDLGL